MSSQLYAALPSLSLV